MKRSYYLLALFAIAGCHHEVAVPGGTITTDNTGKVTKMESKDGSVEINGNKMITKDNKGNTAETNTSISEAELGVPFYPGSKELPGSIKVMENNKATFMALRSTTDTSKQVLDFYTTKLGAPKQQTTSDAMSIGNWEPAGKEVVVIATKADTLTNISVSVKDK